jgi:hypothetical protein
MAGQCQVFPRPGQTLIRAACEQAHIAEAEFWAAVRAAAEREQKEAKLAFEQRQEALERQRLLASLPDEVYLLRVQRYEAHLTRQFSKALHELQRLQAARLGGVAPLALDVDLSSSSSDSPTLPSE